MWNALKVVEEIRMEEIDLRSLPSKFMDACVAKDEAEALRLAKLMAKQNNYSFKAELNMLYFGAKVLPSKYSYPMTSMVKELKKYEA